MSQVFITQVSPEKLQTIISEAMASQLKSIRLSAPTSHLEYLNPC
jgi:hypothetical protein